MRRLAISPAFSVAHAIGGGALAGSIRA